MIKVTIEIAGQQLHFAASSFNIENSDVYMTIAEDQKVQQQIVATAPVKVKVKKNTTRKQKPSSKFNPDYFISIQDPQKRSIALSNKKYALKKQGLLTAELGGKIDSMVATANAEKKK